MEKTENAITEDGKKSVDLFSRRVSSWTPRFCFATDKETEITAVQPNVNEPLFSDFSRAINDRIVETILDRT